MRDGTRIERSCRLNLPAASCPDPDGDGVLWIVGDGITVELQGTLRGAPEGSPGDTLQGVGIRVTGRGVTLRGGAVAGFRVGIHAREADGLVLEQCDVSGNFRQRLRSTRAQEAGEDWVDPHHNDQGQWFQNYGAGIFVERSRDVSVRRCRARRGQNGLVLERCSGAQVLENDFSYLSGWGIALWRSSDNRLEGNSTDFCVRGYSHGVYNRGQDSAGILLFEQCSRNVVAGNSATHCGDGFFAFSGQEALGSVPPPGADFDYTRRGNNDNLIVGNDFSFAAAHGLELTFGFGNRILSNRLEGNSICGIWGGYSRDTLIAGNVLRANGSAGYGLERGGINIEHGQRNRIQGNTFERNECGVHLWWDADEQLVKLPWCLANGHESRENCIADNTFHGDRLALELRDTPGTRASGNQFREVAERLRATPGSEPVEEACGVALELERPADPRAFMTRTHAGGRERIVIDEWGPVEGDEPALVVPR